MVGQRARSVCAETSGDGMTITRPALRYHGGKWLLAPWIIEHFPDHRVYVEPFGGAASVLLRKPRSHDEVYNDLDGEIVSFFRLLQDRDLEAELLRRLTFTPFSRDEFDLAYEVATDPIERARRLLIRSFMGFGSDGCNDAVKTGFRASSNRSGKGPAGDWASLPKAHTELITRLAGVVIENRDAVACMAQHDTVDTLHYVDPPYVHATRARASRKNYRHELSDDDHNALIAALGGMSGMVILSGYRCGMYDDGLVGWRRVDRAALADGARPRTESLWINPACGDALAATRPDMFSEYWKESA